MPMKTWCLLSPLIDIDTLDAKVCIFNLPSISGQTLPIEQKSANQIQH
jgi:hypothetical protein